MLRLAIFIFMLPLLVKYLIQIVSAFSYAHVERRRSAKGSAPDNPKVSVLIPAWNEEVGIIKTIQSVLDTHYSQLELIVINDGSTDRTGKLVTEFIDQYDALLSEDSAEPACEIKYLELPNGGKARALNHGLRLQAASLS